MLSPEKLQEFILTCQEKDTKSIYNKSYTIIGSAFQRVTGIRRLTKDDYSTCKPGSVVSTMDTMRLFEWEYRQPHFKLFQLLNKVYDYRTGRLKDLKLLTDFMHNERHLRATDEYLDKLAKREKEIIVPGITKKRDRNLAEKSQYVLKIELLFVEKPKVWRRITVPGNTNLYDFYDRIICPVMGWTTNYHGFYFDTKPFGPHNFNGYVYGFRESQMCDMMHVPFMLKELINCYDLYVCDFLKKKNDEIRLCHDIGERWVHSITVENIKYPVKKNKRFFDILGGSGACPTEDGLDGRTWDDAMELLTKGKNSKTKEYRKLVEEMSDRMNYKYITFPFEDLQKFDLILHKTLLNEALTSDISKFDRFESLSCDYLNDVRGIPKEEYMSKYTFNMRESSQLWKSKEFRELPDCDFCGGKNARKRCGNCYVRRYCDSKCQIGDWKDHKKVCRRLKPCKFPPKQFKMTEKDWVEHNVNYLHSEKMQAEQMFITDFCRLQKSGNNKILQKGGKMNFRRMKGDSNKKKKGMKKMGRRCVNHNQRMMIELQNTREEFDRIWMNRYKKKFPFDYCYRKYMLGEKDVEFKG